MPLYEYQCKKCHSLTERIQKFSDPPLTICPHCGGEVEQLLSAPAVQFKGSGWYATDYATKSYKDSASKDSAKGGNGSGALPSSEGKSDDSRSKGSSGAEKAGASSDQPAGKK
ncbi:MAG: zinc ribbon domain-containing protein [Candidatus Korobacteraceae bacterium]